MADNRRAQQRHVPVDHGGDLQRRDAVNVMVQCVLNSSFDEIKREADRWSRGDRPGQLITERIKKVLQDFGGVGDTDANKVISYLSVDGGIAAQKFISCL